MLTPSSNPPTEAELVAYVTDWLNLLAEGQLAAACAQLDEPNYRGIRWTPEVIMQLIEETYGPESRFRAKHPEGPVVTPVESASGNGRPSVVAFEDGSGYSVEHCVPLNGSYDGDLTARMELLWRGRQLALVLHDLHVL